jgi:hypothetical protein
MLLKDGTIESASDSYLTRRMVNCFQSEFYFGEEVGLLNEAERFLTHGGSFSIISPTHPTVPYYDPPNIATGAPKSESRILDPRRV